MAPNQKISKVSINVAASPVERNPAHNARKANRLVAEKESRFGYLVHDVSRMLRTLVDQHIKPEGITTSQWWVLDNLSQHGRGGITSTELAKLLDVSKVTMGVLIDRLEMANYVYRRPDNQDRRLKPIFITKAGYKLTERMHIIVAALDRRVTANLCPHDIETTELNLIRLKDTLRELLGEGGPRLE